MRTILKRLLVGCGSLAFGLLLAGPMFGDGGSVTAGPSAPVASTPAVGPLGGAGYVPLSPLRLLDTRPGFVTVDGAFAGSGPMAEGGTLDLTVVGRGGVPATGVGAVVLNLTAVDQTSSSYLTVWPTGAPRPLASNLNPNPGIIEPNLVIAKVGVGGAVSIYNNSGDVNVIADIQGWYPSPLGASYNPLLPARVLDTRPGQVTIDGAALGAGALGAASTMSVPVTGRAGVPSTGVAAVVLNVTATDPTRPTFLTVFPSGMVRPNASNLNPTPGITAPILVIAKVGADGTVSIFNNVGSVNVIADVQGWFPIGPTYTALEPARLLDTRSSFTTVDGVSQGTGALGPDSTLSFDVVGRGGVPTTGVGAVVLNVTAANQTDDTFLTVYPSGTPRPAASNLNPFPGLIAPNLVIGKVGADGRVTIYNNVGTVDVIADIHGWFPSDTTAGKDAATVLEDSSATAIDVLANDEDHFGGPVSIASATQPANGVITLTGGTAGQRTGLSYTPNAQFCGTDTATYTLNGSVTATVTVTVACVNDAPSFTKGANQIVDVDAPLQTVNVWATARSTGPTNESGQAIDFVVTNDNAALFATAPAVDADGDLAFEPAPGAHGVATVTVGVHDDGGTANGGVDTSATQTFSITVNKAPTSAAVARSTLEDTPVVVTLSGADADGNGLAFSIATTPASGTLGAIGPVVCVGTPSTCTATVTYTPDSNSNGGDAFTYVSNDGRLTSSPAVVSLAVSPVNDAPSFATGADQTVLEDSGPQVITNWAIAISPGPADETGQTVAFDVTNDNNALFAVQPVIAADGTLISVPDADANGVATVTVSLSDDGGTADGGDDTSDDQTFVITVTAVNDEPSFTAGADQAVNRDAPAQTVDDWATAISAGPINESTQALNFVVTNDANSLFGVQPAIDPDGTLTYTPADGMSGIAIVSVEVRDDGGIANGGDDTSPAQTFTISINSAPAADASTPTVLEDAGAGDLGLSGTDVDGDALTFALTSSPLHGTLGSVVFDGCVGSDPSSCTAHVSYTPTAGYNGPDSFTYTVSDGTLTSSEATVSITVTSVNDAPSGTDGSVTGIQDTPYLFTPADFGFSDTDDSPADAMLAVQIVTLPAAGTLESNGSPVVAGAFVPAANITESELVFTPDASAVGTPYTTFTFQVQDDAGTTDGGVDLDQSPNTITINITNVNDAPAGTDGTVTTLEDTDHVFAAADFGFTDPNDTPAHALSAVTITALPSVGSLELASVPVTVGQSVPAADIGTLTFTPAANAVGAAYATFTFQVQDDGGTAIGGIDLDQSPNTVTIDVTSVNDAPAGADTTIAVIEDGSYVFTAADFGFTDPNDSPADDPLSVRVTTVPNAGSGTLNFGGTPVVVGQFIPLADIGALDFTPAANANGDAYATFTFRVRDDGGTANSGVDLDPSPNTITVDVTSVNDAPAGADNAVTFLEGSAHTFGASDFGFTDPSDSPADSLLSVTVTTLPAVGALDLGGVAVTIGQIIPAGSIATLTFTPVADGYGSAYTSFTFQVQDNGGTANSGIDVDQSPNTLTINVTGVNDAPSFSSGANVTVDEDNGAYSDGWAASISAGPDEGAQTLTFDVSNDANALFLVQPSLDPTGVLTFTPATNAYGSAIITVTLSDNGGTLNGGVDTSSPAQTFTITVNPVNDPPTAGNDSFETIGNTELRVELSAGSTPNVATGSGTDALTNDADPVEGDPIAITAIVGCADVVAPFDCIVAGAHVIMSSDGTFSYVPAPGATSGTLQYTVTDSPTVGTAASVNGTVTVTMKGMVWYVQGAASGNGTSASPLGDFTTLNGVGGAGDSDGVGDYVFVKSSGTPIAGSIELEADQHLLGEGVGLSVAQGVNGNPSPTNLVSAGTKPAVNGGTSDTVKVTAALPSEIRGLSLSSTVLNAIDLTSAAAYSGAATLSISDNNFTGSGAGAIDVNSGATGTRGLTIQNNTFTGSHLSNGVDVANTSTGQLNLEVNNNTVTSSATAIAINETAGTIYITSMSANTISGDTGSDGINVNGATFDAVPGGGINDVFGGITAVGGPGNGTGTGGVRLINVTGSLSFMQLTSYSSGGPALLVSGSGGMIIDTGSNGTLSAVNGPAADLSNVAATVNLTTASSVNSANTGIRLDAVTGTFSAAVGTISNATGFDFQVNASTATVSYAGSISDSSGPGVSLTSNTTGSTSLTGAIALTSGASDAFVATGSGTVTVTGTNNTLASTTGTALNITNVTIGATGLNFDSISSTSTGTKAGIILDTTGSSGSLTVTGTGSAGSGGTINNKTGGNAWSLLGATPIPSGTNGIGIYLESTRAPSFTNMNLHDFTNAAIAGFGVNGLTLTGLTINGVNGDDPAVDEAAVYLYNVTVSANITGGTIEGGLEDNLHVYNDTGALNRLTVTGTTFGFTSTASGNNSVGIEATGAGTTANATVTGSTFKGARGAWIQVSTASQAVSDVIVGGDTAPAGNTFNALGANVHPGVGGASSIVLLAFDGPATYKVKHNTLNGSVGNAIMVNAANLAANISGRIENNTIGTSGTANSGSSAASGIAVESNGGGDHTALVANNVIRQYNNNGIVVTNAQANGNAVNANYTIVGNTVQEPGNINTDFNAIHLNNGTVPADNFSACVDIGGAGLLANIIAGGGAGPTAPNNADIRVRQRQSTSVRLPGYGGAADNDSAVTAYLTGRNTLTTAAASNTVSTGGGGFTGGAPCAQPS